MGASDEFYDALETRSEDEREQSFSKLLPEQITHAKAHAPYFSERFADIDAQEITTRKALAKLPVTRKSDLLDLQKSAPPFGGLTAAPTGKLRRIYQSPGPIYDCDADGEDWWRVARSLYAAGFREGDIVHNTYAYHLTPAGLMLESGAAALGCAVVPAGVGNTELQVHAMADIRPDGFVGTPSFLKILLEKADDMGADVSSVKKAQVGGEAFLPPLRAFMDERDIDCVQIYASADLGCIAYESSAREGLIVEEGLLIEIVRPGTDDPVPEGEVGEVVATCFRKEYPLVRFGTGDLSMVVPGASPCGRTNMRLQGWMGRADQTTKVKGMFVHPSQIAKIAGRHPEILKARLVVDNRAGNDVMTLSCEVVDPAHGPGGSSNLADDIAASIFAVCKLRGEVGFAEPGSLPNDGKVIDDIRDYEG